MEKVSVNKNPTRWNSNIVKGSRISSLNVRSLDHANYYFDVIQTMANFQKWGFNPIFEFFNGRADLPSPPGFNVIPPAQAN